MRRGLFNNNCLRGALVLPIVAWGNIMAVNSTISWRIARCHKNRVACSARVAVSALLASAALGLSLDEWLIPFLITGWIVHLLALFYCHRLWDDRLRRWQALEKWDALTEFVKGVTNDPRVLSQPQVGRQAGKRSLLPTLS